MIETGLGYLVGLCVGIIMGMLGGGGSLLLPALLYLIHLDVKIATAYTTILVGITALAGICVRWNQRVIDWPTVWALGIPVSVGMLMVRLWLFHVIPDECFTVGSLLVTKKMLVLCLFSGLLFLSFATMVGLIGKNFKTRSDLRHENPNAYYALLLICGLFIGIVPGFAGAGGGVLIVPLLVILFGLPMKTVVGTSLSIVAMKSFVGFLGGDVVQMGRELDFGFIFQFSILMIVGVLIGTWLARRLDAEKLKRIFAWFLFGLGLFMVINEVVLAGRQQENP